MGKLNEIIYLRSIARRWKQEAARVPQSLTIFSPYVTSSTADTIVQCAVPANCEVHILFSADVFASGASSIETVKKLFALGCRLFHINNLHAKIFLTDQFASIGSQNLTARGTKAREASAAFVDTDLVEHIKIKADAWKADRLPITEDMVRDLEKELPLFQRA